MIDKNVVSKNFKYYTFTKIFQIFYSHKNQNILLSLKIPNILLS